MGRSGAGAKDHPDSSPAHDDFRTHALDGPYRADYEEKIFAQTVEAAPGRVLADASVPVDLLSLIIEDVTGKTEAEFFREHIGDALGAGDLEWGMFGTHTGASGGPEGGARFTARQLARAGRMVRHEGRWGAIPGVVLRRGDALTVTIEADDGVAGGLDYMELKRP